MSQATFPAPSPLPVRQVPKLGFVGTGWIGRLRMQALQQRECAKLCAVYDPSAEAAALEQGIVHGRLT